MLMSVHIWWATRESKIYDPATTKGSKADGWDLRVQSLGPSVERILQGSALLVSK